MFLFSINKLYIIVIIKCNILFLITLFFSEYTSLSQYSVRIPMEYILTLFILLVLAMAIDAV